MPNKNNFIHLPIPLKKQGKPTYLPSGSARKTTNDNKANRQAHSAKLSSEAKELSRFWENRSVERLQKKLPKIDGGVPFLLEIEPTTDVEFLRGLGFEIVCDLEEGFIVVSSEQTDLSTFLKKVHDFISNTHGTGNIAKVYALCTNDDRLKKILSSGLYEKWETLGDTTSHIVEISVSCAGTATVPNMPDRKTNESDSDYDIRTSDKTIEYQKQIDELIIKRQEQLENIVKDYHGECNSSFIEYGDSFSVTVKISSAGLRDIVLNHPYIFEVALKSEVKFETMSNETIIIDKKLTIIAPIESSPIVCVIDSGIQENHKYIASAVLQADSVSMIPNETSVDDVGANGGHGTRVGGAVLYPQGIPISGNYQLPCILRNIRILSGRSNMLSDEISRESIIADVVELFAINAATKTKIFNHSVGELKPFSELAHMSSWAAKIDDVSYEHDVLFIQAAGNMSSDIIKAHIQAGYNYPNYFGHELSRISNPAQSLQALTVGSISHSDYETDDIVGMGKSGEVSSFSRVGPGIWDSIKPDVVEFGGTHAISKDKNKVILTTPEEVCPELIRRSPEGPPYAKDAIGTSFAAPKVAYIAAEVQKILPDSPSLLYRALIAQSARWTDTRRERSNDDCQRLLRQTGYGLPDVERATHNNKYRVTLATLHLQEIRESEAHLYTITIPPELKDVGENYNILVEITLSYAAKPRRTRRSYNRYLSTWLDWRCSKMNESAASFDTRIFETGSQVEDDGQFPWVVGERSDWGQAKDFSRSKQTLQKDWCIVKATQLSDEFSIVVRGHKGWGSLYKAKYCLAVSFEAVDDNIEIYELIRLHNHVEVDVDNQEIQIELPNENM